MRAELISALNGDLEREYAAAIQYLNHSAVISGLSSTFANELRAHADDEIGHAKKLNDHINYLGGIPSIACASIFTASDASAMFKQDLDGESEAIVRYIERIRQCRTLEDYGTEAIILDILEDEEHHANDLKTWLGK